MRIRRRAGRQSAAAKRALADLYGGTSESDAAVVVVSEEEVRQSFGPALKALPAPPTVKFHTPVAAGFVVPIWVAPSKMSTVVPTCAVSVKSGVLSIVMLSTLETPVSLVAFKSGVVG